MTAGTSASKTRISRMPAVSLTLRARQRPVKSVRVSQLVKISECEQVAAVCYRLRRGTIEFLLVQTRGTGRWIFPKGSSEPGLTHAQAAAIEAFEEAGVHGRIEEAAFTRYASRRQNLRRNTARSGAKPCVVSAHLCEVRRLSNPKESDRNRTWFSVEDAIQRLRERREKSDAEEFARVVQQAVARIEQLCYESVGVEDRLRHSARQDELHKVQFEALPANRLRLDATRRFTQPGSQIRTREILPCEVLPFATPRHSNRIPRLLSSAVKFKALGTGAKNS
jgi:8-oxo-dGTP pyrophosphatase MutT (NUDIX family)